MYGYVSMVSLQANRHSVSLCSYLALSDSSWAGAHVVNPAESSVLLTAATLNVLPFRNGRLSTALPARHSADPAVRQFTATS